MAVVVASKIPLVELVIGRTIGYEMQKYNKAAQNKLL
jgi:hypothetical protein